jgi:hypothetical protein
MWFFSKVLDDYYNLYDIYAAQASASKPVSFCYWKKEIDDHRFMQATRTCRPWVGFVQSQPHLIFWPGKIFYFP